MTKHHHYECLGSGSVVQLYVSKASSEKPSKKSYVESWLIEEVTQNRL